MSSQPAPSSDEGAKQLSGRQIRPRDFNQSLERGLEIMRSFDAAAPRQTVTELADRTGLTRATIRRFMITLVELGYVRTDGRVFQLTPRVLGLGYAFLSSLGFPDIALRHLERLVAAVQESSEASILDGDEIVYVARATGAKQMTVAINVGSRMPAHATSMGKVLLASLPDEALEHFLSTVTLAQILPRTITDHGTLRGQLEQVRRSGYAVVDQELEEGLRAIAVPVRDRTGHVIGAISLSTNAARRTMTSLRKDLLGPLLKTASNIELDLAGSMR